VVLRVLSLMYQAGHRGRDELADEAIRLTRQLTLATDEPEARGLLALLMLQHARRAARIDGHGRLVTLDEQDRARWDTGEIAAAIAILQAALAEERPGRYQVLAAIAALHDDAPTAADTDWAQVLAWYDDLVGLSNEPERQDPLSVLNRAVAVGHVLGPAAGLAETERVTPALGDRHQWHAVRAYLFELGGHHLEAGEAYAQAASRVDSVRERDHLVRRAARAREHARAVAPPPETRGT
jgi:predicted RNA polymerase sigma factor